MTGYTLWMLHLTRKPGQSIMIGDGIEVVVTAVKGKSVKLGIVSPDDTTILRKEIFDKVHDENQAAQASAALFLGLGKEVSKEVDAPVES